MEKDDFKTDVIFRKFVKSTGGRIELFDGDIIALFPHEPWDIIGSFVMSYMRIGQHGGADYDGIVEDTVLATPDEYASLKAELEGLGYNLSIRKKRSYKKFLDNVKSKSHGNKVV